MLLSFSAGAQTIGDCKSRFNRYLNFKNSLNTVVVFEDKVLYLQTAGKKTFAIYADELLVLSKLFEFGSSEQQKQLISRKGLYHFKTKQLDSIRATINDEKAVIRKADSLPLRGYRIAIDAGHFGTTMQDALIEEKYLLFYRPAQGDTISLFESTLTFNTAQILKHLLEEQGAEVFTTRSKANHTSFDCTYQEFLKLHKRRVLDSLRKENQLTHTKYQALLQANDREFFWQFFRDFDLSNRARKINQFAPHATAIIHYNVDEKNAPWKAQTNKDFTMAFIGGAYTPRDLTKEENKIDFVRQLITPQLERSEKLAAETVNSFKENLAVPVARPQDATYLYKNSIATPSGGVFSRNLVLCRKINSVLVYGESLYQDNEKECEALMRCTVNMYGVNTSERITRVAASYYEALYGFLLNN